MTRICATLQPTHGDQSNFKETTKNKLTVSARGRGEFTAAVTVINENSVATSIWHGGIWRQCLDGAGWQDIAVILCRVLLHSKTLPNVNGCERQYTVGCAAPLATTLGVCLLQAKIVSQRPTKVHNIEPFGDEVDIESGEVRYNVHKKCGVIVIGAMTADLVEKGCIWDLAKMSDFAGRQNLCEPSRLRIVVMNFGCFVKHFIRKAGAVRF